MNYEYIMQWAEHWHYPFLVLSEGEAIRHGKVHYQRLQGDTERIHQTLLRIERWNTLVGSLQREAA
jgi:hypothetical protein